MPLGPPSIAVALKSDMYQNIIFDWSGVINDNLESMHKTINAMFLHFGAKSITMDEFRNNWVQPYMDFYNHYLPNISLEEEKSFFINEIKKYPSVVYPGMVDLLMLLKQNGKNLFVLSSDSPTTLNSQIKQFSLEGVFTKTYTEVYDKYTEHQKLLKENNLIESETVTIADTIYELQVGQRLGISSIGVTWGIHPTQKLQAANPTHIVNTVLELQHLLI